MAKLKYCGNHSLYLSVDQNDFCTQCAVASFRLTVNAPTRLKQISESLDIVSTSNNADTVSSRLEFIVQCAQEFQDFEEKGIKSIEPPPTQIIQVVTNEHDKNIILALEREFSFLLKKYKILRRKKRKSTTSTNLF